MCPPVCCIMDSVFKAINKFGSSIERGKFFALKPAPFSLRCQVCDSKKIKRQGTETRMFRTVPIGSKPVFIQLPIQRVQCLCCNDIRLSSSAEPAPVHLNVTHFPCPSI